MQPKLTAVQKLVVEGIARANLDMKNASLKIGKNHAYLQQFIERGVPRNLPEAVREKLGPLIKVPPDALRSTPRPVRRAEPAKHPGILPNGELDSADVESGGGRDMVFVPERDASVGAGAGGLWDANSYGEAPPVVGKFGFPAEGFRQAFGASPQAVQILPIIGDSMMMTLFPGQRVMVDTTDRTPSPPGVFIVWDGLGLVVKRVEYIAHSDPATVRIISDNPKYAPYERTLDEAHIQGRVIGVWMRL